MIIASIVRFASFFQKRAFIGVFNSISCTDFWGFLWSFLLVTHFHLQNCFVRFVRNALRNVEVTQGLVFWTIASTKSKFWTIPSETFTSFAFLPRTKVLFRTFLTNTIVEFYWGRFLLALRLQKFTKLLCLHGCSIFSKDAHAHLLPLHAGTVTSLLHRHVVKTSVIRFASGLNESTFVCILDTLGRTHFALAVPVASASAVHACCEQSQQEGIHVHLHLLQITSTLDAFLFIMIWEAT